MNILVTGGAGYIGSHVVVELHNAGYQPIILDDFSNSEKSALEGLKAITGQEFVCYTGDCNDKSLLQRICSEQHIDGAIHFAAFKAVGESVEKPLKYYHNNVGSMVTLLSVMEEYNVHNIVFSSSCTVYGQPDHLPVTEESPKKEAESPYGNTKQICEEVLADTVGSSDSLKGIALRYFNPIGAHPSSHIGELPLGVPNNLVPFVTQTAAGIRKELAVFGDDYDTQDGTCVRDYIHVVDLAKAHVRALEYLTESETSLFDVFNIGTGKGNSVLEVIHAFEKSTGEKLNYRIAPRRPGDVEKVFADPTKSQETLGWKAEKSLEEALSDSWNWQLTLK